MSQTEPKQTESNSLDQKRAKKSLIYQKVPKWVKLSLIGQSGPTLAKMSQMDDNRPKNLPSSPYCELTRHKMSPRNSRNIFI